MTRTEYRKARQLIRANGAYALRWMDADTARTMGAVLEMRKLGRDKIAQRVEIARFVRPAFVPIALAQVARGLHLVA